MNNLRSMEVIFYPEEIYKVEIIKIDMLENQGSFSKPVRRTSKLTRLWRHLINTKNRVNLRVIKYKKHSESSLYNRLKKMIYEIKGCFASAKI